MAFYKTNETPRDPSAIDERSSGSGFLATVIVLLIVAFAFGLYFMYAGAGSTSRTVTAPSTTQLSPRSAPAAQPSTQAPTP